ncbi:MAG: hypothetical protein HOP15_03745, partial [Planctomycetes bacterium]|nr:hypothetical protein [Planctomycetota bacterium]
LGAGDLVVVVGGRDLSEGDMVSVDEERASDEAAVEVAPKEAPQEGVAEAE